MPSFEMSRLRLPPLMYMLPYALSHVLFAPPAQAVELPESLCWMTIATSSGRLSACNAVYIGDYRFLTAAHCFASREKALQRDSILVQCGFSAAQPDQGSNADKTQTLSFDGTPTAREVFDSFDRLVLSNPPETPHSEDIALLVATPRRKAPAPQLRAASIAKWPAVYFDGPLLKSRAKCFSPSFRIRENGTHSFHRLVPNLRFERIESVSGRESNSIAARLRHRRKDGKPIGVLQSLIRGDSGSPLFCQIDGEAFPSLVGVASSFNTSKATGYSLENTFSPVFGPQALEILAR